MKELENAFSASGFEKAQEAFSTSRWGSLEGSMQGKERNDRRNAMEPL